MISKVKVGDKIKLTGGGYEDTRTNPIWGGRYGHVFGIIDEIDGDGIYVAWDNGTTNIYGRGDLTIIEDRYKPLDDLMKFIEEELVI